MTSTVILSDNGASSGSAGLKSQGGNDGVLILQTTTSSGTATNAVYVDNAQNVGVGVTPSAWGGGFVALEGNGFAASSSDAVSCHFSSNAYRSSSDWTYKGSNYATRYRQLNGNHTWFTAPSGTAGNAISWTQSLAVGKDTTLALQGATSVAGTGITFPATQSASTDANTLDDYEEGSWTPTFVSTGTSPTITSYGASWGAYQKVGNTVHVQFYILVSTFSSAGTGSLYVAGLPFAPVSRSGTGFTAGCVGYSASAAAGARPPKALLANPGGTTIRLYNFDGTSANSSNMSSTTTADLFIAVGAEIYGAMTFFVS